MTKAISDRALDLGVFALDNELETGRGRLGFGLPSVSQGIGKLFSATHRRVSQFESLDEEPPLLSCEAWPEGRGGSQAKL